MWVLPTIGAAGVSLRPNRAHEMNISLHGLRMNATQTAPGGGVNADTIFEFAQSDSGIVEARYAGDSRSGM